MDFQPAYLWGNLSIGVHDKLAVLAMPFLRNKCSDFGMHHDLSSCSKGICSKLETFDGPRELRPHYDLWILCPGNFFPYVEPLASLAYGQ